MAHRLAWWFGAASVPLVSALIVIGTEVDRRFWFAMPRPLLRHVTSDALLLAVALLVFAAPLAGVAACSRSRSIGSASPSPASTPEARAALGRAWAMLQPLAIASALVVAVSAIGTIAGWGTTAGALALVAASHVTLFAAAFALASIGALIASCVPDPLDAAAIGIGAALAAAFGLFAAGPLMSFASTRLVNAALVMSPIVGTASAANLDVLRSDLLYQLSPIAHRRFDYPAWPLASACYVVVALVCWAMTVRRLARQPPASAGFGETRRSATRAGRQPVF
jgi:hypothetical protein